jgi:hypothetical protein
MERMTHLVPEVSLKAVINLSNTPGEVEHLKRLTLIFDEIYYICPQVYFLENSSLKKMRNIQFNFFQDCVPYDVMTLDNLEETLAVLRESKVAKEIHARDEILSNLRREIALADDRDPGFKKIVPQGPSVLQVKAQNITEPNKGKESDLIAVAPSMAIWDSLILTNTLFLAQQESLFPVFLDPRHRREMEYRFNQYCQASSTISNKYPEISPANFAAQFGEITFSIFNNVWSHERLISKNIEEVIKYRNSMSLARKKYIASLTELTGLAENNPWNQKTKNEVQKYLIKLNADLAAYRQNADMTCKKMFDDLKISAIKIVGKGVAGALAGNHFSWALAPEIPTWGLMIVGALLGSTNEIADAYKIVLDSRRTLEEHKKSSVAYIAEFR